MSDPLPYLDRVDDESKPLPGGDELVLAVETAVDELERVEDAIYQAEKTLNALKTRKDFINKQYIPKMLTHLGTTVVETLKGYKVSIKKYMYVKVNNKKGLADFLTSRGDEVLMDTTVKIKKLSVGTRGQLRRIIVEELNGIVQKVDYSLHHSTQRAYFNRILTENPGLAEEIESFGDVKEYHDTKIVRGV